MKWVKSITRVDPLENVAPSLKKFYVIRDLRNHVNQFDPTCCCFVLEEVEWLNSLPDDGRLILSILRETGLNVNLTIIELTTLPQVSFLPTDSAASRLPMREDFSYISAPWNNFKTNTTKDHLDTKV